MTTTVTFAPDDEAVFITADGRVNAVIPGRKHQLTERHCALLGAAYQVQNDPAYRAAAREAFRLFHTPAAGGA